MMKTNKKIIKIIVVGGVSKDILFSSTYEPALETSNPGRPLRSFGGVALNIARHLALRECHVKLLSVVGDDKEGADALLNAQRFHVDISLIDQITGGYTSQYFAFNRPSGQ